jgi:hypothetical protein
MVTAAYTLAGNLHRNGKCATGETLCGQRRSQVMVRKAIHVLTLMAALLAPLVAVAAGPPAGVTVLPAVFRGNDIYLNVRLNNGAPVWMKFDIGAPGSSIAAAYIKGDARRAARMTMTLGAVTLPGIYFDLAKSPIGVAPDGGVLAGRLGRNWLGDRMIVVRHREHEVWLSAPIDTSGSPAPLAVAAR